MGLKCQILQKGNKTVVLDSNGNESKLYNSLVESTGSENKALDYWVVANDPAMLNSGEKSSVKQIEAYLERAKADDSKLTISEKFQVKSFMRRNGIETLDELNSKMNSIFRKEGRFNFNKKAAVASGMFTQQDIDGVNISALNKLLLKIEGQLQVEDIIVEPTGQEYELINSSNKTVFGTSQRITQEEFNNSLLEAIEDTSDPVKFLEGVRTLPYSSFVHKFETDQAYANKIMRDLSGTRRIPRLTIDERAISDANNQLYTTIKNTLVTKQDDITIEAEIDYLNSIPQDVWEENSETISKVLKEVEKTLIDVNIDIIGINTKVSQREQVMEILEDAKNLLTSPNKTNVWNFVDSYSELFDTPQKPFFTKVDETYKGLNIVSVHSEENAEFLFDNFGLIKVGENLYHKVDQNESIDTIKDYIYEQVKEGNIEIPKEILPKDLLEDSENKPKALEKISEFLMTRSSLIDSDNRQVYSAYQVVFKHNPVTEGVNDLRNLNGIKTDVEYLKEGFLIDFYNYILNEKSKDSQEYREVLSKFEFNDRGLSTLEVIPSIEGLKFEQELKDYIRIHKDSKLKHLIDDSNNHISEDLLMMNFPQSKEEYDGQMVKVGNYVAISPTIDNFLKINGEIYRKEMTRNDADLFVLMETSNDPVYYSDKYAPSFSRKDAKEFFNSVGIIDSKTTTLETFNKVLSGSRINDNMAEKFKELSTLKDKSYKFYESGTTIFATKNGETIARMEYTVDGNKYLNPRVFVMEEHRSKGVGTELYLKMFDKAEKTGRELQKPLEETLQSKNIFERVENISNGNILQTKSIDEAIYEGLEIIKKYGTLYHGTSNDIRGVVRPAISTGVLSENTRKKNLDKVFFSLSEKSANIYAGRSFNRFGGDKKVFKIFPIGNVEILNENKGTEVLMTDYAIVIPDNTTVTEFVRTEDFKRKFLDIIGEKNKPTISFQQNLGQENRTPKEVLDNIISKLEKTGLAKGVYTDRSTVSKALNRSNLKNASSAVLSNVNGFTFEGNVYINNSYMNANTPIHEFGHLWYAWAQQNAPGLTAKGRELIEGTSYHRLVQNLATNPSSVYFQKSSDEILEEALVMAIGDKGELMVNATKKSEFKEWLNELWTRIKDAIGISEMTPEQVSNLNLNDYAKAVSVEMLKGENKYSPVESTIANYQIIGEKGARMLDSVNENTFRIRNLDVAKIMEQQEKTKEDIRITTGWEKGADGKWKYEISDLELRDYSTIEEKSDKRVLGASARIPLLELIKYEELFRAYPTLKNTSVIVYKSDDEFFNSFKMFEYGGEIFINNKEYDTENNKGRGFKIRASDEIRTGLAHEIQHIIQSMEGFGGGTSKESVRRGIERLYDNIESGNTEAIEQDKFLRSLQTILRSGKFTEDIDKVLRNRSLKNYDIILDILSDTIYMNSYGEVESRNVQDRLLLNEQQRAITLLENTETVSRDEQVDVVQSNIQSIENISSIFDSRLELLDLYSSKEEVEIRKEIDNCG